MSLVQLAVRQPVTVAVGVILILLSGIVALRRIPIQLTPNVEDTIVSVTTRWEGASPIEIEQEIVDRQEERLQGVTNLKSITSESQQGQGTIRLEFNVGTTKEAALREVSDKLREVPRYPENVDEPVIQASDPENRDYIAWIVIQNDDPAFDVRTLQDFAEDRLKPAFERVPGVSEINVLGGREREVQIRYDPELLASKGISPAQFVDGIRRQNRDVSAGALEERKADVRVRLVGQFTSVRDVEDTVVAYTAGGPVLVRDVAEVVLTYKEATGFVRSRGRPVLAINVQREVGSNVMAVMQGIREVQTALNAPGGVLETQSTRLGLSAPLRLEQVYDQTIYIDDALSLVRTNIWIGGGLAMAMLLLFLRSLRTAGIVALAIPISVVGAVVAMVALGRSINVISMAGMAFAVGMVVDNAIVVLENIYRHLEKGKAAARAAVDGGREVFGAVLASTLTTVAVFVPILLVEEEAGQLFRDIALAIVAAVALSLLVSMTVIPTLAARVLRARRREERRSRRGPFARIPDLVAGLVHALNGSVIARVVVVLVLAGASIWGTVRLMPPSDYLPQGNRNLVFGLLIPPPSYSLEQRRTLAERIEATVGPFWRAAQTEPGTPEREAAVADLPEVAVPDGRGGVARSVAPPPIVNYFLVTFGGIMFHGGVAEDPERVVDLMPLFAQATRPEVAPGVYSFAFQVPLFRLGGRTGSAIKINFVGDDLDQVGAAALNVFLDMSGRYGPGTVQPDPSNFNVPTPELQLVPDRRRLAESGLTYDDIAFASRAMGDGAVIGEYRLEGEAIDLKVISRRALLEGALERIPDSPIATPLGGVVSLASIAPPVRVNAAQQINRVGRQRAVSLQFTPREGLALEQAVDEVAALLEEKRAAGIIPPDVETSFTGSASKLAAVQSALLGDGSLTGTLGSSLVLALVIVYLLMCVLFQSFMRPMVIMVSVPLATFGGFAALAGIHAWSVSDPYLPLQNLDVLTMLGFVILIGVVVNNAILIVHQSLNFMRGSGDGDEWSEAALPPRQAITEAVRTRVRPIFMSTLTSVGGMAPLIFMTGSGSELYRGLGSVVVGGLLMSTVFTLLLVPLLFSLLTDAQERLGLLKEGRGRDRGGDEAPPAAPVTGSGASAATPAVTGASAGTSATVGTLLLVLLATTVVSCASRPAETRYAQMARRAQEQRVAQTPAVGEPLWTQQADSGVEESLRPRREELEALGGPEAWAGLDHDLGPDLYGREQRLTALTLEHALFLAAEHNLGVRFARLVPEAAAEGVTFERALFDPVFFTDLEYEEFEQPRPVPVLGGVQLGAPLNAGQRARASMGLGQRLPSGAIWSASTFLERFDNRTPGIEFIPDPAWRPGVALDLTQPLLQGYGRAFTDAPIALAQSALQRSEEQLRGELLVIAEVVERSFWDLREARGRLLIQEHLFAQGEAVERVLRERREFDVQPAEYADALATLEQRRAELVRARAVLRMASDRLKALLDAPSLDLADEELLVAVDDFVLEPFPLDLQAAIATAVERRPELPAALSEIDDADLRLAVAENLRRPRLDLVGRVELLGEDDSVGGGYSSLAEDELLGFLVALRFELPLGNRAGRADVRRARIEARASLVRYEELLRDILLDVKEALRGLQTSYELIGAARSFRLAQSENLRELELEKERRRALSPEFLRLEFERQDRLARAQLEELAAIANYNRALATYRRATGTGPLLGPAVPASRGEDDDAEEEREAGHEAQGDDGDDR